MSAIVSFHMGQMIGLHYQKNLLRDDLILITTPEGELHEIGILGAALLCVHYGIKFIYLGPNLPAESLIETYHALSPAAIMLGSSRGNEMDQNFLLDYVSQVSSSLNGKTKLWLGGNVKSSVRTELEKRRITFFPTLHAFDEFLEKF